MYDLELRLDDGTMLTEPHCVVIWHDKPEIRVVFTSDIHYSLRSPVEIQTLRTIVESVNAMKPDLLIMTGDQVDYTRDESHHAAFRRDLLNLEVPVILIPGNNDLVDNKVELFDKYQGAHVGTVRIGWLEFYVMEADTGYVSDASLATLSSVARNSNATLKVVLCHYPIGSLSDDANRQMYINALKGAGVSIAFSGHTHISSDSSIDNIRQVVLVSPSEPGAGQAREVELVTFDRTSASISSIVDVPVGSPVNPIIPNLGTVQAGWANFSNPFPQAMNFTYTFKVKADTGIPTVEGATLVSTSIAEGVLLVRIAIAMQPGQSREVRVYFAEDTTAPRLDLIGMDPATPRVGENIVLRIRLVEQGWGLKSLSVRGTYPNGTTKYLRYTVSGDELRVELPGDRSVREVTVDIVAVDWANLVNQLQVNVTAKPEPLSFEGIMEVLSEYWYAVAVVLVALAVAAYVLIRRR
jgi:predicted phosphodiesterase